jgi:hypothetical protein
VPRRAGTRWRTGEPAVSTQQTAMAHLFGVGDITGSVAGVRAVLVPVLPAPVVPTQAVADAAVARADLTDLTDLAAVLGLSDLAQVHAGVPQAQGDVLVWPWLPDEAPIGRDRAVRSARPVPAAGRVVLRGRQGHTHTLLPDGPGVATAPDDIGTALTVLVVEAGSVAVLAHEDHPDLHIGEGVYLLRRQRRHTPEQPETSSEYVED